MSILNEVFTIGKCQGTPKELAKIVGISKNNMVHRIEKWLSGSYTAEKCMTIGPLSTKVEDYGNTEWDTLSRKRNDARLRLSDIK